MKLSDLKTELINGIAYRRLFTLNDGEQLSCSCGSSIVCEFYSNGNCKLDGNSEVDCIIYGQNTTLHTIFVHHDSTAIQLTGEANVN